MISEERLEEIIKNKGVVWVYSTYSKPYRILPISFDGEREINPHTFGLNWNVENIFETKEQAEFHKNYKNIKSTHILDLPTWEEFQNIGYFYFKDYYGEDCIMRDDVDEITVEGTINNEPYRRELATWTFPRTEDGYLSACEICKKLFLGEIDD